MIVFNITIIFSILFISMFISCSSATEVPMMKSRKMEEIYKDGQIWMYEDQMSSKYRYEVSTVNDTSTWIYAHKNLESVYIIKFNMKDRERLPHINTEGIFENNRKPCFYLGIDINKDGVIDVSFFDKDGDGGMESIYYHGNDPTAIYNELQRQGSNRLFDKSSP